jgi:hypothetical protein
MLRAMIPGIIVVITTKLCIDFHKQLWGLGVAITAYILVRFFPARWFIQRQNLLIIILCIILLLLSPYSLNLPAGHIVAHIRVRPIDFSEFFK